MRSSYRGNCRVDAMQIAPYTERGSLGLISLPRLALFRPSAISLDVLHATFDMREIERAATRVFSRNRNGERTRECENARAILDSQEI